MIHINLLPLREAQEAFSRRKELALVGGLTAVTLVAVLLVHFFQSARLSWVNSELSRLESAVAKIHKQNQDLENMERQKEDLEEKLRVVQRLTSPERRAASVHILDDLSVSTPELLWLTDFAETKGAAKINGKAVDNQTIASFAHNLASSRYFQKIEIRETAQEIQAPEPRRSRRSQETSTNALDAPSIVLTKFLIEAHINYLPSAAREDARGGKEEGEGQKSRENKPTKETAERER
jgi:type IV pilus assembly protein PilN